MCEFENLKLHLDNNLSMIDELKKDLSDENLDYKVTSRAMTLREQFVHLTECHLACTAYLKGEKYLWWTYCAPDSSFSAIYATYISTREATIDLMRQLNTDLARQMVENMIAYHEQYHIGQMSLIRQDLDPKWDSLILYGE